jgi:hypothetical protein
MHQSPAYYWLFTNVLEMYDMLTRRCAVAICAGAIALSGTVFAQNRNQKPQPNQPPKLTNAQKAELAAITQSIDALAAGQSAPNELSLTWARQDLLKAQGGKQYVPFTVMIDPAAAAGKTLTVYWRVVSQTAAAAAPPPPPANQSKDNKNQPPPAPRADYAYEDMNTFSVPGNAKGPERISRSFAVGPGTYDVYMVVKEPAPEKPQKNAPPQKMSLLKQTVQVPDLWNDELNTSSVFVAERIDPLPAPLTAQQQAERPYALGTMEIVPAVDSKFAKSEELQTFLLIYNAKTDKDNKPDVSIEFNFYTTPSGQAEKFFNKTNPQNLNAQTLPPGFDFAAGHQLQAGQAVPLTSFPEGEYRLEIKVTDKLADKSVTRNVNFTVSAS